VSGSTMGKLFCISTWGESHGRALGVTIDGCPAGLPLSEDDIQEQLDRRKPGQSKYATKRAESDAVQILSGVFEGVTTGTPISLVLFNEDQRSRDYGNLAECYRPGHADFGFDAKYGFRDYRGGGRSSGRETCARVAAGAVAKKLLAQLNIEVTAYITAIGNVAIDRTHFDLAEVRRNPLNMPDAQAAERAAAYLDECMAQGDSAGGVIECVVRGVKPGIGEPVFDKLDALLARAVMSIGAVKGIEFGAGFAAAQMTGAENNDVFTIGENGDIITKTNHAGGVLGGISNGAGIVFRCAVKPTPSISQAQQTVDRHGKPVTLSIHGRHDPLVASRAVVVVEAMTAVVLADLILTGLASRMDTVVKAYQSL